MGDLAYWGVLCSSGMFSSRGVRSSNTCGGDYQHVATAGLPRTVARFAGLPCVIGEEHDLGGDRATRHSVEAVRGHRGVCPVGVRRRILNLHHRIGGNVWMTQLQSSKKKPTKMGDELFEIRNALQIGAFQTCINEAEKLSVSAPPHPASTHAGAPATASLLFTTVPLLHCLGGR